MKMKTGIIIAAALFCAGVIVDAAEPVYAGFHKNTSGGLERGLYKFTNLTNAAGSAVLISASPFPEANWQKLGYDGSKYYTFIRNDSVQKGCGLYEFNGDKPFLLISINSDDGVMYPFSNWHGITCCNLMFYGLYGGTNMSGPGLYRFTDPAYPENTAERLFPSQSFPSSIWTDVAFDGHRFLLVRTGADGGTPGIYLYDPNADSFSLLSETETYADWNGFDVYLEPEPELPPVPLRNKKMYVILFGGQSNAYGWGYHQYLYDTNDPLAVPQNDVLMFSARGLPHLVNVLTNLQCGAGISNVKSGTPQQYPGLSETEAIDHFGPELSFGRTVRDLIRIPNSKVAVIKYAQSGSNIYEDWKPDGTADSTGDGFHYRNFQTTVKNGIAALQSQYPDYAIEIIGMGWVQGESDAVDGYSGQYQENLTKFIQDIRATFGMNIVFALSKLSMNQRPGHAGWPVVRAAQDAVAAALPQVIATETDGASYPTAEGFAEGNLHYMSEALLQIGRDLGNAVFSVSGLDSDGDGLPDEWELNHFGDLSSSDGTIDSDGDGLSDMEEFITGTDPVNPADSLRLSLTSGMKGFWQAKADLRYQLFVSSNLFDWAESGSPVLARDESIIEFNLAGYISSNRHAYFRVKTL